MRAEKCQRSRRRLLPPGAADRGDSALPAQPGEGGSRGVAQGRGTRDSSHPLAQPVAESVAACACRAPAGRGVALAAVPGRRADDADRRGPAARGAGLPRLQQAALAAGAGAGYGDPVRQLHGQPTDAAAEAVPYCVSAARGFGGGGGIGYAGTVTLTNSTVFGNSANGGGNIFRNSGTLTFKNSIIGGGILVGSGPAGPDVFATAGFTSADFNLIQTTTGATIGGTTTHNITGVSPNLLPLANYGGPTPSLLPAPNSPVINVGDTALVTGLDQRSFARANNTRSAVVA